MADIFSLQANCLQTKYYLFPSWTIVLKSIVVVLFLCSIVPIYSSKECRLCEQGSCVNDTCVCLPGWRGKNCEQCYGRISLQDEEGIIHDGTRNYSKLHTCSWLLDAGRNGRRVTLQSNEFATECIWDHLYVHNGDSAFSPLVASYSGLRFDNQSKPLLRFILKGRYAFIHFYSDVAFTLKGFNISYRVDDCALGCSENGICEQSTCVCNPGWTGPNCDLFANGCPQNCSNNGDCVNGTCKCFDGFSGSSCFAHDEHLKLEKRASAPANVTGRASFAMAKDDSGYIWILGGYRTEDENTSDNLLRYNVDTNMWDVVAEQNQGPWPRYGHTAVFYQGSLYLFGGVQYKDVMDDLWKFNISTRTWASLKSGPFDLSGHSAQIVGPRMLVFFGYSTQNGYSNSVLEYHIEQEKWTVLETNGSVVQGSYGHTSVLDRSRNKIYVYGGYHSPGSIAYNMTDMLYQFDPVLAEWFILHNSGRSHYLHAAAMMNNLMVVFGGNMSNDSRVGSKHSKCFTSDIYLYDRDCNRWHTVTKNAYLQSHLEDLDRFGQRMLSFDNDLFVFGGYHAWYKRDMWKISPGVCSAFGDEKSCEGSIPGILCAWNLTHCVKRHLSDQCAEKKDENFECSGFNRCDGCLSRRDCKWCDGHCVSIHSRSSGSKNCTLERTSCESSAAKDCPLYQSCSACQSYRQCKWEQGKCVVSNTDPKSNQLAVRTCEDKRCSDMHSCSSCTKLNCMWCQNLKQCILTNAYVAYYFYGQCSDWTTMESLCKANSCTALKTCADCIAQPQCGWCDDGSNTGTGSCHEGGMVGPINTTAFNPVTELGICSKKRWFFRECPECQCNGHSKCVNDTDVCSSCLSHTTGNQCQHCEDGYFGDALNGGNCTACSCNDADTCNPVSGACYCKTRGVIGRRCDRCDEDYRYVKKLFGNGTCFYHLNTDFSYTFNLSKREDSNYTQINFINTPVSGDRDVDFTLNCSTSAVINITYVSRSQPIEQEYVSNRVCDYFRTKFEHKNHAFGGKENTTFFVYIFDFKTPFKLQISFVQRDKLNLVRFFIIFFSCFLSLLLIAAALWKIKHKYDSYRRRRQHIVEMQQMARRPFSSVLMEIDRRSTPTALDKKDHVDKKDHMDSVLRRRKKNGNKPSEVAIEPLADSKAAILTLIVQLPTGGADFTPAGQSGLAIGSALVSMGCQRKQSLEHVRGDKPKVRKQLSNIHADTCA